MELNQINKLFGKTNQDLMVCEQKIQSWTKFMNDYKALDERLTTITDKTRHEIMVPIGGSNMAFMSGYIKHTNEILVLLGDNYFVLRSAKQAKQIVDRRLTNCRLMVEDLNKEKSHLEDWLSVSKQLSEENECKDFVEIVEQYDEQKEREWREEHKRKVREYKMHEKSHKDKDIDCEHKVDEEVKPKVELKSILKKKSEPTEREKSVGFDDNNQTVIMSANEECIGLTASVKQLSLESKPTEEENEIAFKPEIKERDIARDWSESVVKNCSPEVVSRFKANRMKR